MENITDWFSIVSFIASISSLVLAVVAIWIAFYTKSETDRVNEKISEVLIEIKTDAKAISQVAMPELKAYGDSMRRYVLNGSENKDSTNSNNDILEKLESLDEKIKSLGSENDITKLKSELVKVSNDIKSSEINVAKSLSKDKLRKTSKGVRINSSSGASVQATKPTDEWVELLRLAISLAGEDVTLNNYGKRWVLVNRTNKKTIENRFITSKNVSFSDMPINENDELDIVRID
ncbi:hypothetical protein [Halomonas sp. AOP25-F1-15]|uniref:hypothetical protein n=1 Tax=Halomonas sp. AOP25-F1-15 TaxID=3457709 RepID=UPI0040340C19